MDNKNNITYTKGDATAPQGNGSKIIVHICNDIGGWGRGFVMALSKKWKAPERSYREWYKSGKGFTLGQVQFVQVENEKWVANLIGQHKIRRSANGQAPIRYSAVQEGLKTIVQKAVELNATLHMPRIGCGLAGGKWEEIEPLIIEASANTDIQTVVYDFD